MTADEQHSNNAYTDDETTTVGGQDDTTQHTGTEGNTSQTRAEHASEQDGNPPSFTPKDSTRTRLPAQGAHTTASRTGTAKRHRPWWQIIVLVVFVVCAVVAALYANGTIWGTPRAQAMSACRTATAQAQDAHRLAQTAIDDAKKYRDDTSKTIDADALRRMTVLIDDAEKEPAVPSCSITMDNARLNDHTETAKQLKDVYMTITKELVRITSGVTGDDADATPDATSSGLPTQSASTQPEQTATATPSASATASAQPSTSPSSSPKDSASSTAHPATKPSGSASPSASASPSPSATATASPSAKQNADKQ
ncbi:hypothetical protein PG2093B_0713 [Bifidobacterium pseudolongum subsp. globosum]|uniref:Uncharacterized protein n=1 Tax=Bifidobacterium pseudolongum subsp. globosum TaxID=1690 RepID=A0A4Q5A300_9BIFI|nr:hypothetical protein [Bifidobacterium pseudolongum]RYQ11111.1 hypothetical protein PG2093B_0713 [Bifidobacterium pseudolongum subsp. globosum]